MLFYPHLIIIREQHDGKILLWSQEHIKHWIKPVTSVLIMGILSDLARSRAYLMIENVMLRQQLFVLNL